MNAKTKRRIVIFSTLAVIMLAFIWGNSVLDRGSSGHLSRYITEIIKRIFDPKDKLNFDLVHAFVRKTAHYLEFFTLGLVFSLLKNNVADRIVESDILFKTRREKSMRLCRRLRRFLRR